MGMVLNWLSPSEIKEQPSWCKWDQSKHLHIIIEQTTKIICTPLKIVKHNIAHCSNMISGVCMLLWRKLPPMYWDDAWRICWSRWPIFDNLWYFRDLLLVKNFNSNSTKPAKLESLHMELQPPKGCSKQLDLI